MIMAPSRKPPSPYAMADSDGTRMVRINQDLLRTIGTTPSVAARFISRSSAYHELGVHARADLRFDYDRATVVRETGRDRLRVLQAQAEIVRSRDASVRQSY